MIKDNMNYNDNIQPNSAKLEELKIKLPEYFTNSGTFDIEKFQSDLKKQNIDELTSGYQLDFIGKDYAKKQAGERPETVIVPDIEHNQKEINVKSNNLFFTGDNLEVLRHLQQNYQDTIDFIYIDPPYNTGNDGFVYPDNFEYKDGQLKDMFGLDDDGLKRLKSIQGKSTHSAWLAFMYPRLYLAKKLLKETGVMFISIDDNEQANLKLLMDDIFGEGQYIASAPRKTGAGAAATRSESELRKLNDYVFIYSKNKFTFKQKIVGEKQYPFTDEHGNYMLAQFQASGSDATRSARPNMWYEIYVLDDGSLTTEKSDHIVETIIPTEVNGLEGRWMWKPTKFEAENKQYINYENGKIQRKVYYDETKDQTKYQSEKAWFEKFPNKNGTTFVNELMGKKGLFSNPKPVGMIKFFLNLVPTKNITVLDFFAGSSTTADAVMQLNAEDGGYRQFIMATLPEPTYATNSDGKEKATEGGMVAYNTGFRSIDEISRKRIELAAEKIKREQPNLSEKFDAGFKHYRVVSPTLETLDKLEFSDNVQTSLFDDMITPFSSEYLTKEHAKTDSKTDFPWHGYNLGNSATGFDTILQTWLVSDGYKFNTNIINIDLSNYNVSYVDGTRIYLINSGWNAENTKALVNAIGTNKIAIQTIVVYGYSFELEGLRELEIALQQLDVKANLVVRY